jgi:methylated-DNA-[protein]-cysteine S-methyltransferase
MAGNPQALRAVGGANAHNQWPLAIPCHRVVGSTGQLTGFSAPGGLALKARLLELEGISVKNNRVPVRKGEKE